MSKKTMQRIFLGIILLLFGYIAGMVTTSGATLSKKVEYKVINHDVLNKDLPKDYIFNVKTLEDQLNWLGTQGWEFIGFCPQTTSAIYKR